MNASFAVPWSDVAGLAPELLLTAAATLILLLEAFAPGLRRAFGVLSLLATLAAAWLVGIQATGTAFHGLVEATPLTRAFSLAILLAAGIGLLSAPGYLTRLGLLAGEYFALLLWCVSGLLLLVRATELLTVFLALELFSVALYGLAAYHRRSAVSAEAGLKYFLMGAFVSSFVLYGIALLFGETGSTRIETIAAAVGAGAGSPGLLLIGFLLVTCGFAFKLSLVPFHAWAPDVYQGAPTPFVAFLSVAPKIASAVILVRLVTTVAGSPLGGRWPDLFAMFAIVSMLLGNLFALVQRDLKRMLAYSGVAHMGYLMIPLAAPGADSWRPMLVYLVAYALMNAGAFAIAAMLYPRDEQQHPISTLAGWGYRFPFLGICLTVCMVSLGGIPPTAGFIGKYLVFLHAIQHQRIGVAVVGVVSSLIGVVVYLRVVYTLYMKPEVAAPEGIEPDLGGRIAALTAAAGSLLLGIWPSLLLGWAVASVPAG
jgi:NADH-quinone oxidoreductase subunit N